MYICLQHRTNFTTSGKTLEVLPFENKNKKRSLLSLLLFNFVLEILANAITKRRRKGNKD